MDSKISTDISPDEIPEGFTAGDPNGGGGAGEGGQGGGAASAAQEAQSREAQRQSILEQAMTPDALARLRRIKLVKAEKAGAVENMIASMAMQGKLPGRINEGKLIEMLEGLGAQDKSLAGSGKISIQRKKYAFDSDDDDDDNDDDLL